MEKKIVVESGNLESFFHKEKLQFILSIKQKSDYLGNANLKN